MIRVSVVLLLSSLSFSAQAAKTNCESSLPSKANPRVVQVKGACAQEIFWILHLKGAALKNRQTLSIKNLACQYVNGEHSPTDPRAKSCDFSDLVNGKAVRGFGPNADETRLGQLLYANLPATEKMRISQSVFGVEQTSCSRMANGQYSCAISY